jgi:hypothetical protein
MHQKLCRVYPPRKMIHWLKEWDGRPARLFCLIRYGRDARATLCFCNQIALEFSIKFGCERPALAVPLIHEAQVPNQPDRCEDLEAA